MCLHLQLTKTNKTKPFSHRPIFLFFSLTSVKTLEKKSSLMTFQSPLFVIITVMYKTVNNEWFTIYLPNISTDVTTIFQLATLLTNTYKMAPNSHV